MAGRKLLLFAIGVACSFIFIFTIMPSMQGDKNRQIISWVGQGGLLLALIILLISRNRRKS